ncbi:hypothetical protein TRIP_C21084 [Candidatus Zixiibacteriota bacterium]|nr:hypothetical protein TRIP_C21084 [candidate division Zixibacteria bacterium]
MTDAHLFPESIGGRFSFRHCCVYCNNWLGHHIEGKLMKSLFTAFARDQTGIANKEDAFRQINIIDTQSGEDYRYYEKEIVGKPKMRSPRERIAPPKQLRSLIRKDVQKRFPNWVEYYMDQYDSGANRISLPGEIHTFRKERLNGNIEFRGENFFPVDLLAKISYEAMFIFGFFSRESIVGFYKDNFEIYREEVAPFKTRIKIRSEFGKRVKLLNPSKWRGNIDYAKIKFYPSHSIDLRISDKDVAYIAINFFECLRYLVVIGKINRALIAYSDFLNRRIFFPIRGEPSIFCQPFPRKYESIKKGEDIIADVAWIMFNKGKL